MGKALVVNAPSFFNILWRIVHPLIPASTKKRLVVLRSKEVRLSQLPCSYKGGKLCGWLWVCLVRGIALKHPGKLSCRRTSPTTPWTRDLFAASPLAWQACYPVQFIMQQSRHLIRHKDSISRQSPRVRPAGRCVNCLGLQDVHKALLEHMDDKDIPSEYGGKSEKHLYETEPERALKRRVEEVKGSSMSPMRSWRLSSDDLDQ